MYKAWHIPGQQALQIASTRLLPAEVSRAAGTHFASLLVDLAKLYDNVALQALQLICERWQEARFPAGILNLIIEVYAGQRMLQGEQAVSRPWAYYHPPQSSMPCRGIIQRSTPWCTMCSKTSELILGVGATESANASLLCGSGNKRASAGSAGS